MVTYTCGHGTSDNEVSCSLVFWYLHGAHKTAGTGAEVDKETAGARDTAVRLMSSLSA